MVESSVFERFLTLAKRELQCADVRILELGEAAPEASNVVVARLPDGRHVVASFDEPPKEADALTRRLAMLALTFADALASPPSERLRARPPVISSLHEELKALAQRSRAADVVIIDVDSPVVWGSASVASRPRAYTEIGLRDVSHVESSEPTQDIVPPAPLESSPIATEEQDVPEQTRIALVAIRRLPLESLHKGRHLRHLERQDPSYLVLSFSGIYLLCMIFDSEFDELRAERAAHESLPRIERLVLALPPLDPTPEPMGGVVALRRPRRRG